MQNFNKTNVSETLSSKGWSIMTPIVKSKKGDVRLFKGTDYYATINIQNGYLSFNRHRYQDIDKLLNDVVEFAEHQEFAPNTYNPDYRPEAVTGIRVDSVFRQAGFKRTGIGYGGVDNYTAEGVLGMHYASACDDCLYLGDTGLIHFYDEKEDLTDSQRCGAIKSMITALYASNIAKLAENIANMGNIQALDSMKITTIDYKTLKVDEQEALPGIISILKNVLSKLEGKEEKDA